MHFKESVRYLKLQVFSSKLGEKEEEGSLFLHFQPGELSLLLFCVCPDNTPYGWMRPSYPSR